MAKKGQVFKISFRLFLYIYLNFADIILVLLCIILAFTILTFPIFINIKFLYLNSDKKLYFVITLYGFLRLLNGYMTIKNKNILINYARNKLYILPIKNVLDFKKNIKPFLDLHIKKFQSLTEIGTNNDIITSYSFAFLHQYVNHYLCTVIKSAKSYLNIFNDVRIIEKKDIFNIYLKVTVIINLITIIIRLLQKLTEKIFYAKQK